MSTTGSIGNAIESLEQFRNGFRWNSYAGVANAKLGRVSLVTYTDLYFSIEGEFEGVGNEVQNNFLPHIAIHVHRFAQIAAIHQQAQSRFVRGGTEYASQLRSKACQIRGLVDRLHSSSFKAREIQQGINQAQQPRAVATHQLELSFRHRR